MHVESLGRPRRGAHGGGTCSHMHGGRCSGHGALYRVHPHGGKSEGAVEVVFSNVITKSVLDYFGTLVDLLAAAGGSSEYQSQCGRSLKESQMS